MADKYNVEITKDEVIVHSSYNDGRTYDTKVINALEDKAREFIDTFEFELTNKGEVPDDYQRKAGTILSFIKHLKGEATYIMALTPSAISYMKLLGELEKEILLTWSLLKGD